MDPIEEAANRIKQNMNRPGGFAGVPTPPQSAQSTATALPGFYTPPAPSNPLYLSSPVPAPPTMRAVQPTMSNEEFQKQLPGMVDGIKQRMDQPGGFAGVPKPPQQQQSQQPVTLNSNTPPMPSSVPTSNVPTPPSNSIYTPMDKSQIEAEAAARIAKQRAGVKQGVDATKTGLKNTFDYNNQILRDNRVLEDSSFNDRVNPFGGRYDYLKNNVQRDRGIQDKYSNDNYNSAVAAQDQKLSDFDAMAPEQQQAFYDQLLRTERDFGLQEGTLTGNYNGGRTLAGQNADWGRVVDTANLTGNFKGGQTLAAQNQSFNQMNQNRNYDLNLRQQHVNEAKDLSERYGIQVNPTDDYQLMLDQVKGLPTTAQRTAAEKAQAQQQSDAWKAVETLGYVPPQYADIIGVPAGTETQKAKDQAMSNAIQSRQVGVSERNAATSEKNAQTNATKATQQPQPKPGKNDMESEYIAGFDKLTPDKRKEAFTKEKAAIVKDLGLSGYNTLFNMYFDQSGDPR